MNHRQSRQRPQVSAGCPVCSGSRPSRQVTCSAQVDPAWDGHPHEVPKRRTEVRLAVSPYTRVPCSSLPACDYATWTDGGRGLCTFPATTYIACSAKISFELHMRRGHGHLAHQAVARTDWRSCSIRPRNACCSPPCRGPGWRSAVATRAPRPLGASPPRASRPISGSWPGMNSKGALPPRPAKSVR